MKLVIGNKKYSSWSLRPWLVLTHCKIPFEEVTVPLDMPETAAEIARYSPAGRVPVLCVQAGEMDLRIWDSLAICEYLNDEFPELELWPLDQRIRGIARAVTCEMHAGFAAMRNELSEKFLERISGVVPSAEAAADIARIQAIWTDLRRPGRPKREKGPFLFGRFSIADAFLRRWSPVLSPTAYRCVTKWPSTPRPSCSCRR